MSDVLQQHDRLHTRYALLSITGLRTCKKSSDIYMHLGFDAHIHLIDTIIKVKEVESTIQFGSVNLHAITIIYTRAFYQ